MPLMDQSEQNDPTKMVVFHHLGGGLDTRDTPLLVEAGAQQDKMKSPSVRNAEFFTKGGVRMRLGKTVQGSNIGPGAIWDQQTIKSDYWFLRGQLISTCAACQKISAPSSASISGVVFTLWLTGTGTFQVTIRADNSGSPGAVVTNGTSNQLIINTNSGYQDNIFAFPLLPALSSGTAYWICLELLSPNTVTYITTGSKSGTNSSTILGTNNGYSTFFSSNLTYSSLYFRIYAYSSNNAIQGIWDYRYGASSTQKQIAVADGAMYWNDAGTWFSIVSGLGSGATNLWSFATLEDYLFSCDNGNNNPQIWNGSAAYTMQLGIQPTATLGKTGSGGTFTAGTYQVVLVTTLNSGGYRCSPVYTITTSGSTSVLNLTAVNINSGSSTNFGFDIAAGATMVFCTTVGGSTFFEMAAASISTGANPLANTVTAFNITAPPVGTENTLVEVYTQVQGYFTDQVTTPEGKYLAVFNNMLCMAGDADYPQRVWFAGLLTPQIWSTFGTATGGNYEDFITPDGEPITGIFQWNGSLYVFKRHSVFMVRYTGVNSSPFNIQQLATNCGALSHWSIQNLGWQGMIYLSEAGPVRCVGTYVLPIDATGNILDRFNINLPTSYNNSLFNYCSSAIDVPHSRIVWTVASNGSSLLDTTLVYDYEQNIFWENDSAANIYGTVTDSSFYRHIWSGDFYGYVFQELTGTDDNGIPINFNLKTPILQLEAPFYVKAITGLYAAGTVQPAPSNSQPGFTWAQTQDISPSGNMLGLVGNPTAATTAGVPSTDGFDGSDYYTAPTAILDSLFQFTIEGWFYSGDITANEKGIFYNSSVEILYSNNGSNACGMTFGINGNLLNSSVAALPLNTWIYFVCIYQSGVVNGTQIWAGTPGSLALISQGTITGAVNAGGTTSIGSGNGSLPFSGSLMGLTISNIARTDMTQFPTVFSANGTPNGGQNKGGVLAAWPLQLGGIVPLYCDVMLDGNSTVLNTYVFDMSNPLFKTGLYIGGLGQEAKAVQLNFRCYTLDQPLEIDAIGILYKLGRRVY